MIYFARALGSSLTKANMSIRNIAVFFGLVAAVGCGEPDVSKDLQTLKQALLVVGPSPQEAFSTCERVANSDLKSECFGAVGQIIGGAEPELAEKACKRSDEGVDRFECYFRLAEQTRRIDLCKLAGPFARPCSHHLWSDALPEILWGSNWAERPAETRKMLSQIGSFEAALEPKMLMASLDPTDESYWDLAYRAVFLLQCPINVELCINDAPSLLRKSCVRGARRAAGCR